MMTDTNYLEAGQRADQAHAQAGDDETMALVLAQNGTTHAILALIDEIRAAKSELDAALRDALVAAQKRREATL